MRYILTFLFALILHPSWGQNIYSFAVIINDQPKNLLKQIHFNSELPDSSAIYNETDKIVSQLQTLGYLTTEIASVDIKNKNAVLKINCNKAYQWLKLSSGNLPQYIKEKIRLKNNYFDNTVFEIKQLKLFFQKILCFYENNGYPFATVQLDSIQINGQKISAAINVNPYQKITFQKINVIGTAQVSEKFLQNFLNTNQNTIYREEYVKNIDSRIKELQFVNQTKATEINFSQENADINLYLNKKNANHFDGIIGVQQQSTTGKTALIGDMNLFLINSFKIGESFNVKYKSFGKESQSLDLAMSIPTILGTKFGLSPSFQLFKQDTTYINTNTNLVFNYFWKNKNGINFSVNKQTSRLISTTQYQNIAVLPSNLDTKTTFYGLGIQFSKIDYSPNPRKGYLFSVNTAIGLRQIIKNTDIPLQLYQGLNIKNTAYKLTTNAEFFASLSKNLVLALYNQNALINTQNILENEVFRLGGQKILKGFNELSILANAYTYQNVELRYLLEQNSFLFLFYNQAILKLKTNNTNYVDYPLGFGAGINVETQLGILSLSYALGKQRNNPLNLRNGKIHLGISTTF